MKKALIRNSVYTTNNQCAAESVYRIMTANKIHNYEDAVSIIKTALDAAEYKGTASTYMLDKAIEATAKELNL